VGWECLEGEIGSGRRLLLMCFQLTGFDYCLFSGGVEEGTALKVFISIGFSTREGIKDSRCICRRNFWVYLDTSKSCYDFQNGFIVEILS